MGRPATFPLSHVIEGWQKGVPGMKVGGTRRLIIPAAQAYGSSSPSASIPPNSDLVFDIELVSVD
jgi:FKBP-type peptidyl-prolyl cis-trans isomerase